MNLRPAKLSELHEIATLQHVVFRPNEPDSVARYLSYAKDDPTYTVDHSRVIEVDGRIVAHLRIWDRTLCVGNAELLSAAGIGSLCVHPNFRNRGFAKALMADSERYFFDAGYDLGLLFTIIGTPFYEALDWIPIPLPTFTFDPVEITGDGVGVKPLDVTRDLDAVMRIYATDGLQYVGSVIRDEAYWTAGPAQIRSVFPHWGIWRNHELVAYTNLEEDDKEVWVKEVCALPDHGLALVDLASLVLNKSQNKVLRGSLPHGHAFVKTLETMTQSAARWGVDDHMMVKAVNWNRLREKLGKEVVPASKPKLEHPFWADVFGVDMFYWDTDVF